MSQAPGEHKKTTEKAKVETPKEAGAGDTMALKPNIAGLLCYLLIWITGIIFIVREKKNKQVRFHAMQSIVTFGVLTVIIAILEVIAVYVDAFRIVNTVVYVLVLILWVVLMLRAYQDKMLKLPVVGKIAENLLKPKAAAAPPVAAAPPAAHTTPAAHTPPAAPKTPPEHKK